MSNFSNLFPSYASNAAYITARDQLLEYDENSSLESGVSSAGTYDYGQPYTIGYGYDISQHSGPQIISDFTSAGIFTSSNTTGTGQYASLYTALGSYGTGGTSNSGFSAVNTDFAAAFGTTGLTSAQAVSLLDASMTSTYEPELTTIVDDNGAEADGFTLGNDALQVLLVSETYNGVFGPIQADDIATDNVTGFLDNVLFSNNTILGVYSQGLENRHLQDLATSLGLTVTSSTSGGYVVTGINFGTNYNAALDIAAAISQNYSTIPSNLLTLVNNLLQQADPLLIPQGYYVVQPSDTSSTVIDTLISGGMPLTGLTEATLLAINAPFGVTGINSGALLHVPVSSVAVSSGGAALPALFGNETYVLDPATNAAYVVGGLLDGSTAGALIVDNDASMGTGAYTTFAAGTYVSASVTGSATASIDLSDPNGFVLGTYDTDPSLTLTDGTVITLPSDAGVDVTNSLASTATPEQVLLSYLSQLGDSTTASALSTTDFDYQNPTGTAYTVNYSYLDGTSGSTEYVVFQPGPTIGSAITPGAVIDGPSTVTSGGTTYNAYNILEVGGDISEDTISNIQKLIVSVPTSMTAAQFNSFSVISTAAGSPEIEITTPGTVSLDNANITGIPILIADSFGGTTLIAGNTSGETLEASLYGNDTLEAGTGGDYLDAGEGVDTLEGGTGNDVFSVDDDVASTTITGGGGSDALAVGDNNISQMSVTGVGTLEDYSDAGTLALDASELGEFTTLINEISSSDTITLDATSAGTYSLAGDTLTGYFNLDASEATGDVSLAGGASGEILTGGTGSDTFTPGGESETLDGGSGSNTFDISSTLGNISATTINGGGGSNTISSTNGNLSVLNINNVQTLQTNGSDTELTASEFGGFNSYDNTSSTVAGTLQASGAGTYDLATAASVTGDFNLDASLASGTVTLIGNNQAGQTLTGGSGTDTLEAGSGADDALIAGSGTQTLTGGTGGDFIQAGAGLDTLTGNGSDNWFGVYNSLASGDVLDGGSTDSNTLQTGGTDIDISLATVSNFSALDDDGAVNLTASQLAEFGWIASDDSLATIDAATAGTYDIESTAHGTFNMTADVAGVTLIDNGANDETLTSSSAGDDVLAPGSGTGDVVNAIDSGGDDIYGSSGTTVNIGGNGEWGTDNYVAMSSGTMTLANNAHADLIDGSNSITVGEDSTVGVQDGNSNTISLGGDDNVYVNSGTGDVVNAIDSGGDDIYGSSGTTVNIGGNGEWGTDNYVAMSSGTMTLANNAHADLIGGSNSITVGEDSTVGVQDGNSNTISLGGDDNVYVNSGTGDVVNAIDSGGDDINGSSGTTVNIGGNGEWGTDNYVAMSSGTMTLANNAHADLIGGSNSITVGNDATLGVQDGNNTIDLGSDSNVYVNSDTSDTITGGGSDDYNFASTFGSDTINNDDGSTPSSVVAFASGITDENLWFQESGSNLTIDLLGTSDQITIDNWTSSAGNQVASFTADGLTLADSQVASLVSAMATYAAAHSSFNPTTATSMPTDTTLQSAIAASW